MPASLGTGHRSATPTSVTWSALTGPVSALGSSVSSPVVLLKNAYREKVTSSLTLFRITTRKNNLSLPALRPTEHAWGSPQPKDVFKVHSGASGHGAWKPSFHGESDRRPRPAIHQYILTHEWWKKLERLVWDFWVGEDSQARDSAAGGRGGGGGGR